MLRRLRRTPSLSTFALRLAMLALFLLGVPMWLAAQHTGSPCAGSHVHEIKTFASGEATPGRVDRLTREAADLEGRLRAVHLGAHIEMQNLLTYEQVETYDGLRGYHGEHRHGGHEP